MRNITTIVWGLAQALVSIFILVLAYMILIKLQTWESPIDGFVDKVALLILMVTSALVSGTVVLGRPAYLILQQRINEGFLLLVSTIVWLVLILGCILTFIVLFEVHTIF